MERSGKLGVPSGAEGHPSPLQTIFKAVAASTTLVSNPHIPDHELFRVIGRGSYGEVWLARSVVGTFRAVKVVYRKAFDRDRPYEREFDGIQKFEPISRLHEGLVDILQIGRNEAEGYFYYVMELADDASGGRASSQAVKPESQVSSGASPSQACDTYVPRTLRHDLQKRGRLPLAECIDLGLAMTSALVNLHKHGLVHRDVKPSNIIFVGGVPKLADIGLVADMSEARSFVGTDGFIPPEGPGSPSADLYSLGKVLYEISTGLDRHDFPKLPSELKDSPDRIALSELNEIIVKACANGPKGRYASAGEMLADFEFLRRGKSVKRKRTLQQLWTILKKAAFALFVLAVTATSALVLLHRFMRSDFPGDGPSSKNDEANTLCDKAMKIIRNDEYAAFPKAYTNFNRAIELDTNFARAYAGLLELRCREDVPGLGRMEPEEARLIARRLKELTPNLAATHCAQAMVSYLDRDFAQTEKSLRKSIEADPKYELGHTFYGFMLSIWGWPIKARQQLEISRSLAPSKVHTLRFIGHTYFMQRDFTNALAWYRKVLEPEPHYSGAYASIAETYLAMGDYTNAIDNFEKAELLDGGNESEIRQRHNDLRRALKDGGVPGYWQQQWQLVERHESENFYWRAVIQIHLGNTDAAFTWLNKSFQTHEEPLQYLLFHQDWDGVRGEPHYKKLLDEVGFSKVMPPRK